MHCAECVAEWKLDRVKKGQPADQVTFMTVFALAINDAVTIVTQPQIVSVRGQNVMIPMTRALCVNHLEVMSPTQQQLLT